MVFTILYVIAALVPATARLQPRTGRHGFLSVRSDYPTNTATRTLAVASTGPTLKEDPPDYLTAEATDTLPIKLLPKFDWPLVALVTAPEYPVVPYTVLDTGQDRTTEYKDLSAWLDSLWDWPRSTPSKDDERRAKRRARRMRAWQRAWLRKNGPRLLAEQEAREQEAEEAKEASQMKWRARLEFMTMLPATIARWSAVAGPHRVAILLIHVLIATADANPATWLLTRYWLSPHWVWYVYATVKLTTEWIIDELLLCAYLTARRAVHEALDYFKCMWWFAVWLLVLAYDRACMTVSLLPAVLEYYAWLPAFKRGQAYMRALTEYEYRKLRSAAFFVFEEWNNDRFHTRVPCEDKIEEPALEPEDFFDDVLRRWSLLTLACAFQVLFATTHHAITILANGLLYASDTIARCGRVGLLSASLVAILIENGEVG